MSDTTDLRGAPEPDAATIAATGAAPPPPGTVVWSMLAWEELMRDGWKPQFWGPLDGSTAGKPDLRGHCIVGRAEPVGAPSIVRCPASGQGQDVIHLNAYFIR